MKKLSLALLAFVLVILSTSTNVNAQEQHYSQFWMTPLFTNPSNAGNFDANIRAVGNYRDQWRSVISNPYKTFAFALDMKMFDKKWRNAFLGVGLDFISDKAGAGSYGKTGANLSVAYQTAVDDKHSVMAGIAGGYASQGFNNNSEALLWGSEIETVGAQGGTIPNNENNVGFGDFSAGLGWSYLSEAGTMSSNDGISFDAGFAAHHLSQPDLSLYEKADGKWPIKMVIHANSSIGFRNTNMGLEPGIIYTIHGSANKLIFGTMVKYWIQEKSRFTGLKQETTISVGAHLRAQDALIISSMLKVSNYKIGLSYDINLSGLTVATSGRGGVELAIQFITPTNSSPRHRTRL